MDNKFSKVLDNIGLNILRELKQNARTGFSEIGRRVGLSSPAVAERVYKMEELGIIGGYHVKLDPVSMGFPVLAFITLKTHPKKYSQIYSYLNDVAGVMECHHISGHESLIIKMYTTSVSNLDSMIEKLSEYGETKTSIVLSSPIDKKTIDIPGLQHPAPN